MKYERSGPKPKLKFQMIRAIKAIKKQNKKVTAAKILDLVSEPITLRTLQRELKKSTLFSLIKIKKKIILNNSQKRIRLEMLRSWFQEKIDFSKIIFQMKADFY